MATAPPSRAKRLLVTAFKVVVYALVALTIAVAVAVSVAVSQLPSYQ